MITGNKATDYLVLYSLNDYDLGHVCQLNQYTRNLCKDDTFWLNRTIKRFDPILGDVEQIRNYKEENGFDTWRNYYIDLVNSMENYYENPIKYETRARDDYNRIVHHIKETTKTYVKCYYENATICPLDWLNKDFVDLNHMFRIIIRDNIPLSEEQKRIILTKIFELPWFKINPNSIELFYADYGLQALNTLLTRNSKKIRHEILTNMISTSRGRNNKVFDKLLPYIENSDEILNALFKLIREGYGIEKVDLLLFLDKAVEKGATKADIEKYFESSKGLGNTMDIPEEESYDENMNRVKKYIKKMKFDKLGLHFKVKNIQTKFIQKY